MDSKPAAIEQNLSNANAGIPLIDLSEPDTKAELVRACEELGFFKVINPGIPLDLITDLESQVVNFFSLPLSLKQKAASPHPFGFGDKKIGQNGDVGSVEYLLLTAHSHSDYHEFSSTLGEVDAEKLLATVNKYIAAVTKMAANILQILAGGLGIHPTDAFSRLLEDEESDSLFRVNHYPPCPESQESSNCQEFIRFGEHTDPQIISVLRSNSISGLQILLKDGRWISVPPDHNSFFINVGDTLQVLSNGRLKSVKHRVVGNGGRKSRVSMIYFGAPALSERIAPSPSLLLLQGEEDSSLYKEFTWFEYKYSANHSRLSDNRLAAFQKI